MRCNSILVVDDHADIRESLEMVLSSAGFRVRAVRDGEEAIQELKTIPGKCLVLLDLMMPRMNGWDFLEKKREEPNFPQFEVVVVSAQGAELIWRSERMNADVVGYIRKPFDIDRLLEIAREYCDPVIVNAGDSVAAS